MPTFLSDAWFDEVDKIRAELGEPEVPEQMQGDPINFLITGGPEGDKEVHYKAGQFTRGLADDAPTKLIVPFDVAKSFIVEGDQQAAMQAFMSGQIRVEGDMSRIMAMQAQGPQAPSDEQQQLQERIRAVTD